MTDIVERLRKSQLHIPGNIVAEAADEIERLRKIFNEQSDAHVEHVKGLNEQNTIREDVYKKQIERLREALREIQVMAELAHVDAISFAARTVLGEKE